MKKPHLTALIAVSLVFLTTNVWSRPVDLSAPTGEMGASDAHGYLEIWRQINEVGLNLGKDSYLPLRYKFSSAPNTGGLLGSGFYCPMLEARNVRIRERMMQANLPCGKALYLRRDAVNSTKFQTADHVWTGALNGDEFVMWRDDGWKVRYTKGRLVSIANDDNHEFTWSYESGLPTGIKEDGRDILQVETNPAGLLTAVTFENKKYEVKYGERPLVEMLMGQTAIKQLVSTLSSFKYPDGKIEIFKFGMTPERIPTIAFTDPNQKQTAYTWDATTSYIATEKGPAGNWTYTIGSTKKALEVPSITRTAPDGFSESIDLDNIMGITKIKSSDGSTITTSAFRTPGPLYGKVKEITHTVGDKIIVLERYSYDDLGRVIRKVDINGFSTILTYGDAGKIADQKVLPPSEPSLLSSLQAKEKILSNNIANASDAHRSEAIQQLAYFYIYQMGDLDKALAMLPRLADSRSIFSVNLHLIVGNRNLTAAQKTEHLQDLLKKYPEQSRTVTDLINIYSKEKSPLHNPKNT